MCKAFDWGPPLEEAIEHWKRVVTGEDTWIRSTDCALCNAFDEPALFGVPMCEGCPVSTKTGRVACIDSPYDEVVTHLHKAHRGFTNTTIHCDKCPECARLAQEQVAFLKGLRPVEVE